MAFIWSWVVGFRNELAYDPRTGVKIYEDTGNILGSSASSLACFPFNLTAKWIPLKIKGSSDLNKNMTYSGNTGMVESPTTQNGNKAGQRPLTLWVSQRDMVLYHRKSNFYIWWPTVNKFNEWGLRMQWMSWRKEVNFSHGTDISFLTYEFYSASTS